MDIGPNLKEVLEVLMGLTALIAPVLIVLWYLSKD